MKPSSKKSALTNASFSAIAMRIAQKACSWAADPMQGISDSTMPAAGVIAQTKAERFCADIKVHLDLIERLAAGEREG